MRNLWGTIEPSGLFAGRPMLPVKMQDQMRQQTSERKPSQERQWTPSSMTHRESQPEQAGFDGLLARQGGVGLLLHRLRKEQEENRSRQELDWLESHGREYSGQWIALDGNRLLASGIDPKTVLAQARDSGVELPLMVRIPDSNLPFGGW